MSHDVTLPDQIVSTPDWVFRNTLTRSSNRTGASLFPISPFYAASLEGTSGNPFRGEGTTVDCFGEMRKARTLRVGYLVNQPAQRFIVVLVLRE